MILWKEPSFGAKRFRGVRWGIAKEESRKDRVLDLCLELIDDCRPFFIGLLGGRYGWVPKTLSRRGDQGEIGCFGLAFLFSDGPISF
jgi:Domain of unknown function (DUF4062)